MTECRDIEARLPDYFEGTTTPEEKNLIEKHLESCNKCSAAYKDLVKTIELVRGLEEVEPPLWFKRKIMARVKEEAGERRSILHRIFYPLHVKIPVEVFATCLVVVIALFLFKSTTPEMKALKYPEAPVKAVPKASNSEKQEDVSRTAEPPSIKKDKMAGEGMDTPEKPPSVKKHIEKLQGEHEAEAKQEKSDVLSYAEIQERREKKSSYAQPRLKSAEAKKAYIFTLTVQTKDVQAASKSIENLLEKSGIADSRSEQEGGDNVYIFSIDSQKINELYTGIIAFAGIKEKSLPKDLPEGKITVRIAITGN